MSDAGQTETSPQQRDDQSPTPRATTNEGNAANGPASQPNQSDRQNGGSEATSDPSGQDSLPPDAEPSQPPSAPKSSQPSAPAGKSPAGNGQRPPATANKATPPTQVYKPEVILSQHHAESCLVGLGDAFPAMTLSNLEGESQALSDLYGDRMTVVVFWNASGLYAREQFTRMMQETQAPYQPLGVNVVAINVGDGADVVRELATKHGVTVPCLLDPEGQAFQQVATGLLPRTYLLDAEGRILWFDLEYSRSQRAGLHNAIYYHLKQGGV